MSYNVRMDRSRGKKPLQFQRIGGIVAEDDYMKLKSKLALQRKTITEWLQEKVQEEIKKG